MALNEAQKSLLAVAALIFVAAALLMASLEYSSSLISYGSGPGQLLPGEATQSPKNGNDSGAASPTLMPTPVPSNPPSGNSLGLPQVSDLGPGGPQDADHSQASQNGDISLMLLLIAAVIMCVVSVTAYVIRRRRRARLVVTAVPASTEDAYPANGPGYFEGRYALRFPQIREPFPLTWGTDEPLELEIRDKAESGHGAMLTIDGNAASPVLLENGVALVRLEPGKGPHRITVSPIGGAPPEAASRADVRIVDYREEIVQMFNELCGDFKARVEGASDRMTPRELAAYVNARAPGGRPPVSETVVGIFETANYSEHAMRRNDYEQMYLSEKGMT